MKIELVNIKNYDKDDYIYIGRPSKYGNPFSSKQKSIAEFKVDNKKESLDKFEQYLDENPNLIDELLDELESKGLSKIGCYCSPSKCHGDIYIKKIYHKRYKSIL